MRQLEIVPTFATQLGAQVLANAHAHGDVDGDDASELLFGSVDGDVAIYKVKGERLEKWRSCCVDGSVTAICVDTSTASDARVFVATAEGACFVVTESGDEFRVASEFRVALNVCALAVLDGDLVVATQDGGLFIYSADTNALGGYKQLEKFEIKREIASLQLLAPSAVSSSSSTSNASSFNSGSSSSSNGSRLVVRCTSGEFFHVTTLSEQQKKRTVQTWRVPMIPAARGAGTDEQVTFIVDGVKSSSASEPQIAVASLAGNLSVFNAAHELQWRVKLPEAVVALDRLSIASPSTGDIHDVLVACTWSGGVYVVESPTSVVCFRMLYPAVQMLCADVYETVDKCERILVGISTSGVIFMFRHLEDTLGHALAATPLIDTIRQSELFAQISSDELRREVIAKFLREASPLNADLLPFASKDVSIEDIVRLAVSLPLSSS